MSIVHILYSIICYCTYSLISREKKIFMTRFASKGYFFRMALFYTKKILPLNLQRRLTSHFNQRNRENQNLV